MPIEFVRFGVGHRRPDGPRGTTGISAAVLHSDTRGVIAELAFARGALIEPHSNPNTTYFIVIEGGGWVLVGNERARVAAGEAVVWPPGLVHGAWTEETPMRAFVVEFVDFGDPHLLAILDGEARPARSNGAVERANGALAERPDRPVPPARRDDRSGEPL